ncbi:MAG: competence protein ComEC, partial [Patescibacteria group bacterium]|nr:competence protein ComEC [Patescibacteria group bacterium]
MKRTKQIWVCVLAWLIGLGLATQFATRLTQLLWLSLVVGLVTVWKWVKSWLGYVALFMIFLCAGLLRGQLVFSSLNQADARSYIGQKHELVGVVQGTPFWNDDKLYEFYIQDVRLDGQKISGLVKVKTLSSGIFEGQTVRVSGKLGRALGRASAQMWYADVATINPVPPLPIRIKRIMQQGLERSLSPTAASFASGLLFGGTSQLPDSVREATQQTGLTHVVAVSGFNLTIIIALVLTFLRGRLRLKTIIPILVLVGFFVIMTGATSSVIRAAVMTALVLIVGTQNKKLSA